MTRSSVGRRLSENPTSVANCHHIGHRAAGGIGTILVVVVELVVVERTVGTVCVSDGAALEDGVTATKTSGTNNTEDIQIRSFIAFLLSVLGIGRVRLVERQRNTVPPTLTVHLPFVPCERTH
jgi:hypothetical protein